MDVKYRQYVVYLKDNGTNRVTSHRVKAPDRDLAARSFSERGLHTLGAEDLRVHLARRLAIVGGAAAGVLFLTWGAVHLAREIQFFFF